MNDLRTISESPNERSEVSTDDKWISAKAEEARSQCRQRNVELITLVEFIVAFLMGLAACCFLFWGILDGALEILRYQAPNSGD